jgi:hypothetical protein
MSGGQPFSTSPVVVRVAPAISQWATTPVIATPGSTTYLSDVTTLQQTALLLLVVLTHYPGSYLPSDKLR